MKKFFLSVIALFFSFQKMNACAGEVDSDYTYFNLFAQELIHNKEYQPFLLTERPYSFYGEDRFDDKPKKELIQDENIESWQKYFDNQLSYDETNALVKVVQLKHLVNWSKGNLSHNLTKKLGTEFFKKYQQGIQYLIKAKELEPYMNIMLAVTKNNIDFLKSKDKSTKDLNYTTTMVTLMNSYKTATNKEIKLRYAYQIIRLNHYTRNYDKAIQYFDTLVTPLKIITPIYYYALDQKAGAQRGLNMYKESNWNFFQVFIHSRDKKESAYLSMILPNNTSFEELLKQARTPEEKNMAYFLLGYSNYTDPIPLMEKMFANNSESDILKVLTARSINGLERQYLRIDPSCDENCKKSNNKYLPIHNSYSNYDIEGNEKKTQNYINRFDALLDKIKTKSDDAFWQISSAYIKFLNKDYPASQKILSSIKTDDPEYIDQIKKMEMLNEIVSQPKITSEFENLMMEKYSKVFKRNSDYTKYYDSRRDTSDFLNDILANRYFLQGEAGKSFLMNNNLSDLQYNPNSELVKQVEAFYNKPNKNKFEKYIAENFNNVGNTQSFFNTIYGDKAMRDGNFTLAKSYYEKAQNFSGIPRLDDNESSGNKSKNRLKIFAKGEYDGYHNISSLVFGHNVWESFQSSEEESMKPEDTSSFPFIKDKMNKLELANAILELEKIGKSNSTSSSLANQLIGNLLYNTSILGYYRHIFVMDVNNENGPKFHFDQPYYTTNNTFTFYYKNFLSTDFIEPDNFDISINYYQKALQQSNNREQKARILFQMASAEQGKYYQWESKNAPQWNDSDYDKKSKEFESLQVRTKNEKYRTYFAELKKNYNQTNTFKELKGSCLYFNYYSKK